MLAMYKHNVCGFAPSLDYILEGGSLTWDANAPDIRADDLVRSQSEDEKTAIDEACEFLSDYLAKGPATQADVIREARANGISERTVKRAKKALNLPKSERMGGVGSHGYWEWRLPDNGPEPPKDAKVSVGPLSENIKRNANQVKPVAPLAKEEGEL